MLPDRILESREPREQHSRAGFHRGYELKLGLVRGSDEKQTVPDFEIGARRACACCTH